MLPEQRAFKQLVTEQIIQARLRNPHWRVQLNNEKYTAHNFEVSYKKTINFCAIYLS